MNCEVVDEIDVGVRKTSDIHFYRNSQILPHTSTFLPPFKERQTGLEPTTFGLVIQRSTVPIPR